MRKLRKIALPGILLASLIIRIISLNQSLWLDEATTALAAKMPIRELFTKFLPGDFHPPLYYLLMKGWTAFFSTSEIALRIPSVIFGVATVYLVYLIAKKLFDGKTAIIASALTATSGLLIYYSQEARMYSLAAMLTVLSVYLFIKKKWLFFGVTLALIGLTDYVALFILPVFILLSLKNIKKIILSLIPLFISFGLWLPVFWEQLGQGLDQKGTAWWSLLGVPTIKNIFLIPTKFIFGRISFDNIILYGGAAILTAVIFGLMLYKARRAGKLIWCWLILPVVIGILVSLKIPTLSYFRFLFCLSAFYILIAKGIESFGGKKMYSFVVAAILLNLFFSGKYLFDSKFHRENWRDISIILGSDRIIYPSSSQREALIYYGKGDNIVYYENFEGEDSQIWLSRYVWNIFDPRDAARTKIENLGYNKVQELNLNGVEFWKYVSRQK